MNTLEVNNHKITYYSDIDDTPIGRYNIFQQNLLYDSSVGSTMEQINERFQSLDANLQANKIREAVIERNNLQVTFFSILSQVNFVSRALVCLIYSIDDKMVTDLSEGGISTVLAKLEKMEVPMGAIKEVVFDQKKKIDDRLEDYFPKQFVNVKSLEYYGKLKERTLETLKYINTEDDKHLDAIEKMTQDLFTLTPPIVLDGSKNCYMIELEKQQSQLYFGIEEMGISNPEQLSLLKFYSLIEKKEQDKIRLQQNQRRNG